MSRYGLINKDYGMLSCASCKLLMLSLVELMANRVRESRVIHTDETRVPVQAEGQCKSGRIWTYIGDCNNPYVVYDYTPDRTRAGPQRFLLALMRCPPGEINNIERRAQTSIRFGVMFGVMRETGGEHVTA